MNGNIVVGNHLTANVSTGFLTINGGTANVSGNITIGSSGTVAFGAGTITAANIINSGNFTHSGGGILGNATTVFTNYGNFTSTGASGLFLGKFVNYGSYVADDTYVLSNGFTNYTTLTINAGHSMTVNGSPLDNEQTFNLNGGTLILGNGFLNNSSAFVYGNITGTGGFTNNGQLTLGTSLNFNNSGAGFNNGNFYIGGGNNVHLNNSTFTNNATLALGGGFISGAQSFINNTTGIIVGAGFINAPFQNAGTLYVDVGTLNIAAAFTNTGVIQVAGGAASVIGGNITNNGTVQGLGSMGNSLTNNGEIAPMGGTLTLNGALTNFGLLSVDAGSKLLARNFPANAGVVDLTGGTFDTGNHTLINNSQITGYGTINTGGLTNNGAMNITGATSTINGDIVNSAGHEIQVLYNPAIFTGNFTNNGIFKSTRTTVTFAGNFTENGTFFSDPATQHFGNVSISSGGVWLGSTGDEFILSGNFISASTANTQWDTDAARLAFSGGGQHAMSVNGTDLGQTAAGYANDFSWGILSLSGGDSIVFQNDSGAAGAGLYVHALDLPLGISQLASLSGPASVTVYYDPHVATNGFLNGGTFALAGGATLTPIPEPGALMLLALGVPSLLTRRRK